MAEIAAGLLEYGVAEATLPGQAESGDRYVIRSFSDGVLLAVVDGLGHGQEAAAAARVAAETIAAANEPTLISLINRCHENLRMTRGAVMSAALFSAVDSTVTWLGVGNVAGELLRAEPSAIARHETLLLRAGLLGHRLPPLRAEILTLSPGDSVILATDGVDADFAQAVRIGDAAQVSADRIFAEHKKGSDDAVVVVTRYLGRPPGLPAA
jgi:phosphoserine phosphatase RsbX